MIHLQKELKELKILKESSVKMENPVTIVHN